MLRCAAPEAEEKAGAGAARVTSVINAINPAATASRWDRRRRKSRPKNPARPTAISRPPPGAVPTGEGWKPAMPPFGGPGRPVPVMVALDTSFPGFGSGSFPAVVRAVFKTGPVVVTVATTVSVVEVPLASDPMAHTPVPLEYVPVAGVADTSVSPAGSRSVTRTPVAFEGPRLLAAIV